jgi:hypothetical protein
MRRVLLIFSVIAVTVVGGAVIFSRTLDRFVFHPDELSLEKRFRSIALGTLEVEVRRVLGEPDRTIVYDPKAKQLLYREKETEKYSPIQTNPKTGKAIYYPYGVLPERPITNRLLIYAPGTVFAYYYIGVDGEVEHIFVWTS